MSLGLVPQFSVPSLGHISQLYLFLFHWLLHQSDDRLVFNTSLGGGVCSPVNSLQAEMCHTPLTNCTPQPTASSLR